MGIVDNEMHHRQKEAAQAVNQAMQSISLTPELEGNRLSKSRLQRQAAQLLTVYDEMDGVPLRSALLKQGLRLYLCEYVYMCMSVGLAAWEQQMSPKTQMQCGALMSLNAGRGIHHRLPHREV